MAGWKIEDLENGRSRGWFLCLDCKENFPGGGRCRLYQTGMTSLAWVRMINHFYWLFKNKKYYSILLTSRDSVTGNYVVVMPSGICMCTSDKDWTSTIDPTFIHMKFKESANRTPTGHSGGAKRTAGLHKVCGILHLKNSLIANAWGTKL
jgi:hypothetical protein